MELELLKHFEAVQMEIEMHICSFQNPFSNFGYLGCRNPVSSTFLTPKLALKVVSENANNVYSDV